MGCSLGWIHLRLGESNKKKAARLNREKKRTLDSFYSGGAIGGAWRNGPARSVQSCSYQQLDPAHVQLQREGRSSKKQEFNLHWSTQQLEASTWSIKKRIEAATTGPAESSNTHLKFLGSNTSETSSSFQLFMAHQQEVICLFWRCSSV